MNNIKRHINLKKKKSFVVKKEVKINEFNEMMKKDEIDDFKSLLIEKNCKTNLIRIIIATKYFLLISGTILIFISANLKDKNQNSSFVIGLIAGSMNWLSLCLDKIKNMISKRKKNIKMEIWKMYNSTKNATKKDSWKKILTELKQVISNQVLSADIGVLNLDNKF